MTRHDGELDTERDRVEDLYRRLDAERARVAGRYRAALRSDGGTLVDRDVEVHTLAREARRLDVAEAGLCFGRLDTESGERRYIGRIGIFDDANEYEPLLLDWRAPAARPFYTATAAHPEGMRRRRQFHSRGRTLVSYSDETLGRPDIESGGDAALLAAVSAPRGEGMRDIVATVQAEQDEIIRLEHPGVTVVEGGPGTGKTVVALHRVAYLLYTQRERLQRSGVLVVGPNRSFLHHIGRVLPSLGESDVVFATPGTLLPGLSATATDAAEVARLKGALSMADALAVAVADRQRLPDGPVPVTLSNVEVRFDAEIAGWARDEARASGLPHNRARAVFVDVVTWALTERAIGRIGKGWLSRTDRAAWERLRDDLRGELADDAAFTALLDELWPTLTPETVLAQLYTSPSRLRAAGADPRLRRSDGAAWTVSDVPLLDELAELLGGDTSVDVEAAREHARRTAHAAAVLDGLVARADHMEDDDLRLFATDVLDAEGLAERFADRDTRELAERAAVDRDWTYGHVVVDEAQELSEMDWRVLMRRCPSRSFTVVGDLAQRRSAAGASAWADVFDRYVPGRWVYRSLTVNYRTPAEIMAVAAAVLAEFAPELPAPESVRACGVAPWSRRVSESELRAAVEEFVADEAGREGTCIVIGPPDVPGAVPASETKGLEFDAVLVVDPDRILADGPRGAADLYVALTRATQRLGILHRGPLPPVLDGAAARAVPGSTGMRAG
ncbi:RNA polymerase recycling motor ATPase HelR [Prescottella sp. R16]|uniref:RNA polymerase recycling motor ATPase HelR n=1 Tax=Prescottella sp. R16 TaxID=3064529 RepID=UPI00272E6518|nr:RNA polymerase recycling motor ATPase HelR [Prescottella sp. R16]